MPTGKDIYRVGISGSYGGMNLGDEAILQSIIAQLRKDLPQVEITVFSRDAEDTKRRHQVERAVPVRKLSRAEIAPEVEKLDLLIVGGSGSGLTSSAGSAVTMISRCTPAFSSTRCARFSRTVTTAACSSASRTAAWASGLSSGPAPIA